MKIVLKESYALLWMMCLSGVDSSSIARVKRADAPLQNDAKPLKFVYSIERSEKKTYSDSPPRALGGDEREHSRTNGGVENTYAPVNRDEDPNMFTIPRILNRNDRFMVAGTLKTNPQKFNLSITSGKADDVPCIIDVNFMASITIGIKINGTAVNVGPNQNIPTQDYFPDDLREFKFEFMYTGDELNIMVDESHLHVYRLEHDIENLKYIQLSGDIEKVKSLSFHFA
ncbi:hypothetical protein EVAR_23785_1 [Eumeta japonica]|uniref:Galectin n=1 Tax=Eumeta variegata TaxID=151549 RepID=A0A4C1VNT7_EUMVA|nr:hypothetical protein EVAR_23785_1 [Eumeta japonica]